jgi:hypothetical protein
VKAARLFPWLFCRGGRRGGYGERFPAPVIADEWAKTFADVWKWLRGWEILVVTEKGLLGSLRFGARSGQKEYGGPPGAWGIEAVRARWYWQRGFWYGNVVVCIYGDYNQ